MSDKSLKDSPKLPKSPTDDIEDWDDFEEVDLSKKRYFSDEALENYRLTRLSQEQVIESFRQTHGNKYDYSKVEYVGIHDKVIIVCPEHGEFLQAPSNHKGGAGCNACSTKYRKPRHSPEYWLDKFKSVHGDRFDYSKSEITKGRSKITIICSIHGEFEMEPKYHANGRMCSKCSLIKRRKNISKAKKGKKLKPSMSNEDLVKLFKSVHGDKFDYSKVDYVNMSTKVIIICSIHGEFQQTPKSHKNGSGCARCSHTKKIDLTEAKRLLQKGLSVHKVSQIIGISQSTLKRQLEKEYSLTPSTLEL